ncbi:hypothetical protein [Candidatus Phytoplasma tritici]|uniref:hypothetical protein n=1 Tax=Candidatus Phytoplasma tritici TaxID=321961 RepID=UPI000423D5B7|nr:hypothetical protein [Candidatus Phytoplasma tritici]
MLDDNHIIYSFGGYQQPKLEKLTSRLENRMANKPLYLKNKMDSLQQEYKRKRIKPNRRRQFKFHETHNAIFFTT